MPAPLSTFVDPDGKRYRSFRSRAGGLTLIPEGFAESTRATFMEGGWIRPSFQGAVGLDREALAMIEEEFREMGLTVSAEHELAIFVGADTPYRKVTVGLFQNESVPVAFAKLPLTPAAALRIDHEQATLARIEETPLANRAPKVIGRIDSWLGSGLVTTALIGKRGPIRMSGLHSDWIELGMRLGQSETLTESAAWSAMESRSSGVQRELGRSGAGHALVLKAARAAATSASLSCAPAHGDFTRWNIRVIDHKVHAFDWEAAIPQGPLLYDLFYHAMTQDISLRLGPLSWDSPVRKISGRRWPHLSQHYDSLKWCFLLFVADEFGRARKLRPGQPHGPIWKWLIREIGSFGDELS